MNPASSQLPVKGLGAGLQGQQQTGGLLGNVRHHLLMEVRDTRGRTWRGEAKAWRESGEPLSPSGPQELCSCKYWAQRKDVSPGSSPYVNAGGVGGGIYMCVRSTLCPQSNIRHKCTSLFFVCLHLNISVMRAETLSPLCLHSQNRAGT